MREKRGCAIEIAGDFWRRETRDAFQRAAGNKFITSFVRYLRLCRATAVSHIRGMVGRGWITPARCKCRCNALVQHAGRARVTPLCLLPTSYIEYNATRRPDLYFSCTRKIHLVVRHTGLSLRHNHVVPLSRRLRLGLLLSGAPRAGNSWLSHRKRRAIIPRAFLLIVRLREKDNESERRDREREKEENERRRRALGETSLPRRGKYCITFLLRNASARTR